MLKAKSKFRLIILMYMMVPIVIISFFLKDYPVFFDLQFQKALILCLVAISLPMLCSPLLFGINWLFLNQIKKIDRKCSDVKNGNYSTFHVPNEPKEPGDENEMIFLMRNMNWMIRRIEFRETELEKRVSERTKSLQKKNSQLVAATDQAKASAKAKSMFLATMSHEIRTPLNAMIGMSELVLASSLTEEQKEKISTINSSSKSLLRILNDILDFSKLDAKKMNLDPLDADLWDLLENIKTMFLPQTREKNLEFILAIDSDLPGTIKIDALKLTQVINNLISNAIKFTEKGKIILKVDMISRLNERARIKFSINDTGVGMDKEKMNKLFLPFSQADGSISRQFGGTGLGLAISQEMISLMGGEIQVNSNIEQGSHFYFILEVPVISFTKEEKRLEKNTELEEKQCEISEYKQIAFDEILLTEIKHLGKLIEQNSLEAKTCSIKLTQKLKGSTLEKKATALNAKIRQFDFHCASTMLEELKVTIARNE